jgi:hypothetical protein
MRSSYKTLVEEFKKGKPLRRPWRRWDDNIKLDVRKIGCGCVNWIQLVHDRVQFQIRAGII